MDPTFFQITWMVTVCSIAVEMNAFSSLLLDSFLPLLLAPVCVCVCEYLEEGE